MTTPAFTRAWHLVSRPAGEPKPSDFALREVRIPALSDGQVLVRNLWLSVDPYMRRRMDDVPSYVPPFRLGEPMDGAAVGVVVESAAEGISVGDHIQHMLGWREHAVVPADQAGPVDPDAAPLSAYLGALGTTGLTAYAGLVRVADVKPGDVVFVSGAAGAVGSQVGQMAALLGASRVIGSAGTADKVALLREEYGFDAAFDYHDGPVADQLGEAAPDGVDVYFDNVGGEHLEAALGAMRLHGRVVLCGMISQYNSTETPTAPRNLILAINKRLKLEGILARDHADLRQQFLKQASEWMRDGRLRYRETVAHGIESAPRALMDLLRGGNTGKMVVRLADE
ncbi:NADP-dependent oxidoreductase [Streptomyces sp. NPDC093990]|uniref:NADP-dependent oxidoreductase n=1 Tax=Streptomyces sp. NPDC093990 TaxID=3155306 RepID=UPI003443A10C